MKRKFILLPITLIALTPMISMVACNNPNTPPEPEPTNYVVLDNFRYSTYGNYCLDSTEEFLIKTDTSYYFKIDTTKWPAQKKSASDYDYSCISIDYLDEDGDRTSACVLNDDFEMLIDGKSLDKNLWRLEEESSNTYIEIDPEGLEQILNGNEVIGHLHAVNLECDSTDKCYFELYAEPK